MKKMQVVLVASFCAFVAFAQEDIPKVVAASSGQNLDGIGGMGAVCATQTPAKRSR